MNVSDFLNILQNPDTNLSAKKTRRLEDLIKEYPYFQAARALYLKGLKNQESYKYNNELKITAAYTTDREVLFNFISSEVFNQKPTAENTLSEKETAVVPNETAVTSQQEEIIAPEFEKKGAEISNNAVETEASKEIDSQLGEEKNKNPEENNLSIGKPLEFDQNERHSFSEWLQLTSEHQSNETFSGEGNKEKKKKFELLDRFIENNPKIVPSKTNGELEIDIKDSVKLDKEEVMTETLARVYLEQKKYKKAIKAYGILSLKNPEKSGFFADQIEAVKKLQKEKD